MEAQASCLNGTVGCSATFGLDQDRDLGSIELKFRIYIFSLSHPHIFSVRSSDMSFCCFRPGKFLNLVHVFQTHGDTLRCFCLDRVNIGILHGFLNQLVSVLCVVFNQRFT